MSKVNPVFTDSDGGSKKDRHETVIIEFAPPGTKKAPLEGPQRLRNAKTKLRGVSRFKGATKDSPPSKPLLDLGPAPKNRHMLLLYYFINLAEKPESPASYDYMEQLIKAGADVNAHDKKGQTVLHEVARDWRDDIASFLIDKGASVTHADVDGVTPLHIAGRCDNVKVAQLLLDKGADLEAVTKNERQTPLHYAARYDAGDVIEVFHEAGTELNTRDHKGRTPLLLAAVLDRSVAASRLLDYGAEAGIIDKTGQHTLCAMVDKMPMVAYKALDQFHLLNRAKRQQLFYLNYLEPDPKIDGANFLPMSVLGSVVNKKELKLIGHPVIREILKVKFRKFGHFSIMINLFVYLAYLTSWTVVVFIYTPWKINDSNHKAVITVAIYIAIVLFIYLLIKEVMELQRNDSSYTKYKICKAISLEEDLKLTPPKLTEEIEYLENQIDDIKSSRAPYFEDIWNWYDWLAYLFMFITSVMVLTTLHGQRYLEAYTWYRTLALWTSRLMCLTLVIIWVKLLKFVRVFSFLGPFVVIIQNLVGDVVKIVFVAVVFYVPTAALYYHFFKDSGEYYSSVQNTLFTVFRILLVDDYGYDDISNNTHVEVINDKSTPLNSEKWWTDLVIAWWLASGAIIVLNLFIALMSDTFQRVYDNAAEIALLERANAVLNVESNMPEDRRLKFLTFLKKECCPRECYYDDDGDEDEDLEAKKYAQQTFNLVKTLQTQLEQIKEDTVEEIKSEIVEKLATNEQQIKDLRLMVNRLTRVLEAQRRFTEGASAGQGVRPRGAPMSQPDCSSSTATLSTFPRLNTRHS